MKRLRPVADGATVVVALAVHQGGNPRSQTVTARSWPPCSDDTRGGSRVGRVGVHPALSPLAAGNGPAARLSIPRGVVLDGGAEWIWNRSAEQFPGAIEIVDLYPAKGHLRDVAKAVCGAGADLATRTDELAHVTRLRITTSTTV